jgi:hypothetical protein
MTGNMFVGAFGWNVLSEGGTRRGTASFEVSNADPSSEAFSVLVRYSDGTTQSLPPSLAALDALTNYLDSIIPGMYTIESETGLLDLSAAGAGTWRPDYQFIPVDNFSDSEIEWYNTNKDSSGVAFNITDLNGDSLLDIVFYTGNPAGKQNIYFVSY